MRRPYLLVLASVIAVALIAGCGKTQDKPVVRITDNEGKLETRTITVGYVNERLEAMTPPYIPDIAGDEGKKVLLDDVVRKELLVIQALRLGLDKHERQAAVREYYLEAHAEEMLQDELFVKPSEVMQEELEAYYDRLQSPFRTAEKFGVHDIIDPRETRPILCHWVEQAYEVLPQQLGPIFRNMRV